MRRRGPWSGHEAAAFLARARVPLRLACHGAAGHPLLASLWFLPEGDRLWCATQRSARVAQLLRRDARCAFEVAEDALPYRGLRGQGHATLHDERGPRVLESLIERYLPDPGSEFAAWLRRRAASETAICIEPTRVLSWDFRERMGRRAGAS